MTEYLNFEGARLFMIYSVRTGVKVVEILMKRRREARGGSREETGGKLAGKFWIVGESQCFVLMEGDGGRGRGKER
jgi:hypothetical protein